MIVSDLGIYRKRPRPRSERMTMKMRNVENLAAWGMKIAQKREEWEGDLLGRGMWSEVQVVGQ